MNREIVVVVLERKTVNGATAVVDVGEEAASPGSGVGISAVTGTGSRPGNARCEVGGSR